jgi:hypothetical protein
VLPHPDHEPAGCRKRTIGLAVALNVAFELVPPPVCIRLWTRRVERAHVPEAAIDEDDHLDRPEHDVSAATDTRKGSLVDSIAKAEPMQLLANAKLRLRIAAALALHAASDHIGGGTRTCHQIEAKVVSYSFAMRTIMLS